MKRVLLIAGPTASGKSSRAVTEALSRRGEIISVDSRQIYRGLDIGTEKISSEEMRGIPHHLLDIREPEERYSAGEFVNDASRLIREIHERGNLPILAGGTHFYFDALIRGLPLGTDENPELREELEQLSTEELHARVQMRDPRRARELDPRNRRRLIRALEIIASLGMVPLRQRLGDTSAGYLDVYAIEWLVLNPEAEVLRRNIGARLEDALERGLIEEVTHIRERVGDLRLSEFGLEYRIVGEYLRKERTRESLLPALVAKLWQYARRQKAWLRKLALHTEAGQNQ